MTKAAATVNELAARLATAKFATKIAHSWPSFPL